VTYTGNGNQTQNIAHSLGSTPGCIIIKRTNSTSDWNVSHRAAGGNGTGYFGDAQLFLNTTAAINQDSSTFFCDEATDTTFRAYRAPGSSIGGNISGATYVAYLFAHDAGGFGLTGTDNVISCGSVLTGDVSTNVDVNLGYEPQWILMKRTDATSQWFLVDVMRGWVASDTTNQARPLFANLTNAESSGTNFVKPTATGFTVVSDNLGSAATWIYIAIRRPMKVPTSGTSVFSPNTTSNDSNPITTNFPVDMLWDNLRAGNAVNTITADRLRGTMSLSTSTTSAEASLGSFAARFTSNTSVTPNVYADTGPEVVYSFRRAPSFFDEVCYTGTGANRTVAHNLGVAPELMIVKSRSYADEWPVYSAPTGNNKNLTLNTTSAQSGGTSLYWNLTTPTASVFSVSDRGEVNSSGQTYVAYLFATCAGVSKVGSYTGTGTTKQIDCGFTGGARFVLIKKTSGTGSWYVWDSSRGIVSGNDPYLLLNSTAAEVTNTDYIDAYSAGFEISSTAPAEINASGGTYIFLSIA
jgi:hypothetical protein